MDRADKFARLELGMSRADVLEILGPPVSTSASDRTCYLNYQVSENGTARSYYVRLDDEKVESFGPIGDFDSTKNPTLDLKNP